MGQLRVLDPEAGDLKTIWDPENEDEVAAARAQFDVLVKKKKYQAFQVGDKKGEKAKEIKEFDPTAGKIILSPPVAGG